MAQKGEDQSRTQPSPDLEGQGLEFGEAELCRALFCPAFILSGSQELELEARLQRKLAKEGHVG